jgi:hypothetical protein
MPSNMQRGDQPGGPVSRLVREGDRLVRRDILQGRDQRAQTRPDPVAPALHPERLGPRREPLFLAEDQLPAGPPGVDDHVVGDAGVDGVMQAEADDTVIVRVERPGRVFA